MSLHVIIMAGGIGKRMKSKKVKVLHDIMNKPMIGWVIETAKKFSPSSIVVVYGDKGEEMKNLFDGVKYVYQPEPLGTADAVSYGLSKINNNKGNVLILSGDVPLLSYNTLKGLIEHHRSENFDGTVLTFTPENVYGYGRIIREGKEIMGIVEEKDATSSQKEITEVNSGVYAFSISQLQEALEKVDTNNVQGEYYLTDVIDIIRKKGGRIGRKKAEHPEELQGVNTREDLTDVIETLRKKKIGELQEKGVTILMPQTVYIETDVKVGRDTVIYPNVIIRGQSEIGTDCTIGPFVHINNKKIPRGSKIGE